MDALAGTGGRALHAQTVPYGRFGLNGQGDVADGPAEETTGPPFPGQSTCRKLTDCSRPPGNSRPVELNDRPDNEKNLPGGATKKGSK
jgi:hypothetical protein